MKNNFSLGCHKSPYDKRDYLVTTLVEDVFEKLPSKVDYTDEMSPIKNQGREGSCVGHAGCAVKEWMEYHDYGLHLDLSERFLYEESKKISGHKEGTTLKACAQVLVEKGVCEEKFWEYEAGNVRQPLPGAYHNALKYKINPAYVRITNEKELKASIYKFGVLHIGVGVTNNWRSVGKDGIIPKLNWWQRFLLYFGYGLLGGHAIAIVGYDDATGLYKFKNSWSEKWGKDGYGYMYYSDMKATLLDAFQMIDLDDPDDWEETPIKRVENLTWIERKKAWV